MDKSINPPARKVVKRIEIYTIKLSLPIIMEVLLEIEYPKIGKYFRNKIYISKYLDKSLYQ